jgi:hypothetical protein
MIYGSNPTFLKKGTTSVCFVQDNNRLSALDMQGAQVASSPLTRIANDRPRWLAHECMRVYEGPHQNKVVTLPFQVLSRGFPKDYSRAKMVDALRAAIAPELEGVS